MTEQRNNIPTLLVLVGPTGVGKTDSSIQLAQCLQCPIVSADSRQIYREIPIGTAAPTPQQLTQVTHYFIGEKSIQEDYNAGQYERDALQLLNQLFQTYPVVLLSGGSMLYVDALCNGLDNIPSVPAPLRHAIMQEYQSKGLSWLQQEVQKYDPHYWNIVDQQNPQRLLHCLEICRTTGKTFSELRRREHTPRPFRIIKVGLTRPREQLYERINQRVQEMIDNGLLQEANAVYPFRQLNSLQTVGFRELFDFFDGKYTLEKAIEQIQQNSRHYAKRQLTWFNRDKTIHWLDANLDYETILHTITHLLHTHSMQEDKR